MIENVTIVGRGALGILLGDAIGKSLGPENVCFLAEGDRLARYEQETVCCNGQTCSFRYTDGTSGEPAQLLIFAVKTTALKEAMELAAPCVGADTVILSVLNGVTSEEVLSQTFGPEKVLYAVAQGMDAVRQGSCLTYHSPGTIFLGLPQEDYFDRQEKLEQVCGLFHRVGLPVREEADILHRMWCKFMLNVGINQVCMAFETDYGGAQRPGPARETVLAAMDEVRKVGACQGVLVTQNDLQEYVKVMDSLEPTAMPSMRQDALAHRPSEVEAFAGTVLKMAEQYGMRAPVNQMLYDKIREMETKW